MLSTKGVVNMTNTENAIFTAIDTDVNDEEEVFDFSSPESVVLEVVGPHDDDPANLNWNNWSIECYNIIDFKDGVTGAVGYEMCYGGFLDYIIKEMIDCPGAGWFVVENITATYIRGDGWSTDDDMDFYYENVRAATKEEIEMA